MENIYHFVIVNTNDKSEALKHLVITAEDQEHAEGYAQDAFEEFKNGLSLSPEEFA